MLKLISLMLLAVIFTGLVYYKNSLVINAPSDSPNESPIKIAVSKTPLSTPFYIADQLGSFDRYCGNVEILDVIGGKRSFAMMAKNEADFATSSDSVIVFQSFQRSDFVNIATFVESVNDIKIIANSESGVNSGADLKGKSIGYIKGSASDYFLSAFLGLHNLEKTDVKLVSLRPEETDGELLSGNVDAISTWEPYAFKAFQGMPDTALSLDTKHIYSLTFNLLTKKSTLKKSPEKAECLLRALSETVDYISANPDKSQRILKDKLKLGQDFIDWVWPDYLFILSLNKSIILTMNSQAKWQIETGSVKDTAVYDFMSLIDSSPLRTVKPSAVRL